MVFDIKKVRNDFPVLKNVKCFLDSGASAQKPQCVIDTVKYYSDSVYANVHRGTYPMSEEITKAYEKSRESVANFINADTNEIVFTKNATESINLVANSLGSLLQSGDEIIISEMEHHANIVPWQLLAQRRDVVLKVCPILDDGSLDMNAFKDMVNQKTALVAITHTSNVLGSVVDVKALAEVAHTVDAKILVDGSQSIVHKKIDVQALGVDFFVFTGHKLYAPTGVGVLYGRYDILDTMPPFLGGGDMIESVSFDGTTFAKPPFKFEAGTPPIVQAIGLGRAVEYMCGFGDMTDIMIHENMLYERLVERTSDIVGLRIIGTQLGKVPIFSFVVDGIHAYDIASLLSNSGVCVRVGNHCAEPLMKRFGISGTVRASIGMYTTKGDIDYFVVCLRKVLGMLR